MHISNSLSIGRCHAPYPLNEQTSKEDDKASHHSNEKGNIPPYCEEDCWLIELVNRGLAAPSGTFLGKELPLAALNKKTAESVINKAKQIIKYTFSPLEITVEFPLNEYLQFISCVCNISAIELIGSGARQSMDIEYLVENLEIHSIPISEIINGKGIDQLKKELDKPPNDTDFRLIFNDDNPKNLDDFFFKTIDFIAEHCDKRPLNIRSLIINQKGMKKKSKSHVTSLIGFPDVDIIAILPSGLTRYYGRTYDESLIVPITKFILSKSPPRSMKGSIQSLIDWMIKRRREIYSAHYDYSDGLKTVSKSISGYLPCSLAHKKEWQSALSSSNLAKKLGEEECLYICIQNMIKEHHQDSFDALLIFWLQFRIVFKELVSSDLIENVEKRIIGDISHSELSLSSKVIFKALTQLDHSTLEVTLFLLGWSVLNAATDKMKARLRSNDHMRFFELKFLDTNLSLFLPFRLKYSINYFFSHRVENVMSITDLIRSFSCIVGSRNEALCATTNKLVEMRVVNAKNLLRFIDSRSHFKNLLGSLLLSNLLKTDGKYFFRTIYQKMTDNSIFLKKFGQYFLEGKVYQYISYHFKSSNIDRKWILALTLSDEPKAHAFSYELWKKHHLFRGGNFLRTYFYLMIKKDLKKGIFLFHEILKNIRVNKSNQRDFFHLLSEIESQKRFYFIAEFLQIERIHDFLQNTIWKSFEKETDYPLFIGCINTIREFGFSETAAMMLCHFPNQPKDRFLNTTIYLTLNSLYEESCVNLPLFQVLWEKFDTEDFKCDISLSRIEFYKLWLEIESNPEKKSGLTGLWISEEDASELELHRFRQLLEHGQHSKAFRHLLALLESDNYADSLDSLTVLVKDFLDQFIKLGDRGVAKCCTLLTHDKYLQLPIKKNIYEKKCLTALFENKTLPSDFNFIQLLNRLDKTDAFIVTVFLELSHSLPLKETLPIPIIEWIKNNYIFAVENACNTGSSSSLVQILAFLHILGIPLDIEPPLYDMIAFSLPDNSDHPSYPTILLNFAKKGVEYWNENTPAAQHFFFSSLVTMNFINNTEGIFTLFQFFLQLQKKESINCVKKILPMIPSFFSSKNLYKIDLLYKTCSEKIKKEEEQKWLLSFFIEKIKNFQPKFLLRINHPLLTAHLDQLSISKRKKFFQDCIRPLKNQDGFYKIGTLMIDWEMFENDLWISLFYKKHMPKQIDIVNLMVQLINHPLNMDKKDLPILSLVYHLFSTIDSLPAECYVKLVGNRNLCSGLFLLNIKPQNLIRFFFKLIKPSYPYLTQFENIRDQFHALCEFYDNFFSASHSLYEKNKTLFLEHYIESLSHHISFFIRKKEEDGVKYGLSFYIMMFHLICSLNDKEIKGRLLTVFNSNVKEIEIRKQQNDDEIEKDFYQVKLDELKIPLEITSPKILNGFKKLTEEVLSIIITLPHEQFQSYFEYILFVFTASLQQNLPPSLLMSFSKKMEKEKIPNFAFKMVDLTIACLISLTTQKRTKKIHQEINQNIFFILDHMEEQMIETTWTILHHPSIATRRILTKKEKAHLLLKWNHFFMLNLKISPVWEIYSKFNSIEVEDSFSKYFLKVRTLFSSLDQSSILNKEFERYLSLSKGTTNPKEFFNNFLQKWILTWITKGIDCYKEDFYMILPYQKDLLSLFIETDSHVFHLLINTLKPYFSLKFSASICNMYFDTAINSNTAYAYKRLRSFISTLLQLSNTGIIQGPNCHLLFIHIYNKMIDCLSHDSTAFSFLTPLFMQISDEFLRLNIPFTEISLSDLSEKVGDKQKPLPYILSLFQCREFESSLTPEIKVKYANLMIARFKTIDTPRKVKVVFFILKQIYRYQEDETKDKRVSYLVRLSELILEKHSSCFNFSHFIHEIERILTENPSLNRKNFYGIFIHNFKKQCNAYPEKRRLMTKDFLILINKFRNELTKKESPLFYMYIADYLYLIDDFSIHAMSQCILPHDAPIIKYCLAILEKKIRENHSLKSKEKGRLLLHLCDQLGIFKKQDYDIKMFAESFEKTP